MCRPPFDNWQQGRERRTDELCLVPDLLVFSIPGNDHRTDGARGLDRHIYVHVILAGFGLANNLLGCLNDVLVMLYAGFGEDVA